MSKHDNFGDKANTNGFDKNPDNINRNGAPVSFRSRFKEMIKTEESVIWVNEDQVEIKTDDQGKVIYGVKFHGEDAIVASIMSIAKSKKNLRVALDALKFLWEQVDGKAVQAVDLNTTTTRSIGFGEQMVENTEESD